MYQRIKQLPLKAKILFMLFVAFAGFLLSPPSAVFPHDDSTVIYDRFGKVLSVFLNKSGQWQYPPMDSIGVPAKLRNCVVQYEDRWFDYHTGVNPLAIIRAMAQDIVAGKIVSGASTLTIQVARISNPGKRTILKKLQETFTALKLEIHFSKAEILKMYLNHAPYGGNIVGYRTASARYFGKEPKELTWAEAALLAVLPNAPGLLRPGKNIRRLKTKRDALLRHLAEKGFLSVQILRLSLIEKIPRRLFPFARQALHLSMRIQQNPNLNGRAVFTTINPEIQQRAVEIAQRHNRYLRQNGINNISILVCDTQSGEVLSYIGSSKYFNRANNGMVDGVQAARSSGSLLKPFLYALAMDQGLILPESKIKDIPTYYGPFAPSNADKKFRGLIHAHDALVFSLNVPAVRLLFSYGQHAFYSDLKQMGLKHLFRPAEGYGLPLIIGGAEVTLWEMTTLFRGLGRGGRFSALNYIKTNSASREEKALISSGAASLTLQVLRELKRPGSEYYWQLYQQERPIAWKTGTSYGQRDAWAVGVTPQWTIGVWVGNFSGEGNPELAGARTAGPVLFDLFNMLAGDKPVQWFQPPENGLKSIKLCAYSGYRATENCPLTIDSEMPVNARLLESCPWHKTQFIADDEKYQVCSLCWQPGHYHTEKRLVLPADVIQYLRNSGKTVNTVLPHNPKCPAQHGVNNLKIIYPTASAHLWVPREYDGTYQKVVARAAHRDIQAKVYWYLDGRYLGITSGKNEKALNLTFGKHQLLCIDDRGNRVQRIFFSGKK